MMVKVNAVMLVIFLSIMSLYVRAGDEEKPAHPPIPDAFVADAGSSGTRLFAFNWSERIGKYDKQKRTVKPPQSRPKEMEFPDGVKNKISFKLATIVDAAQATNYVNKLKEIALKLPGVNGDTKNIPIYIKATAGMRLLTDEEIKNILKFVGDAFNGVDLFKFEKEHLFVTSGTEEAIYDWLSVNYLKKTLKAGDPKQTWGALDLGGASTQIAFAPDPPTGILNDWASVRPFDHTFRLYAVSHLGYGGDQIELQIADIVRQKWHNKNPCLFKGAKKLYSTRGRLKECEEKTNEDQYCKYQEGSGRYEGCKNIIKKTLALDNAVCQRFYKKVHCSINGAYIPSLPADMKWVAFSAFWHTMGITNGKPLKSPKREIKTGGFDQAFGWPVSVSVNDIESRAKEVCGRLWNGADKTRNIKTLYPNIQDEYLIPLCLKHVYVHTILKDGYHFDEKKKNIYFRNKIEGQESGWQWGSILYDANLLPYKVKVEDGNGAQHSYEISRAKSEYRGNYMDAENEIYEAQGHSTYDTNDGNGYYHHQLTPLLLTVSVIFMMVIICIYCICGLGVIGFYSFCCYHQYNKATSDQQHIDIESL